MNASSIVALRFMGQNDLTLLAHLRLTDRRQVLSG